MQTDPTEPTNDQCSKHAKVFEADHKIGYAIWYPQMGGYVGKAVAVMDKQWTECDNGSQVGGCIDIYVWHDGEFPFSEQDGSPALIYHCDPAQFVEFGKTLIKLNARGGKTV